MNVVYKLFLFFPLWFVAGCGSLASSQYDAPLHRLQQSVASASPFGVRWISPNKREFKSGYYLQASGKWKEADALPQRMYAHWFILGDRRPYKVEVNVYVERRTGRGSYSEIGTSRESALALFNVFRRNLDKRLDGRNFVDDYKAF